MLIGHHHIASCRVLATANDACTDDPKGWSKEQYCTRTRPKFCEIESLFDSSSRPASHSHAGTLHP